MASDDDPLDWLPSGWTFQIKKINDRKVKCYLNPEGQKFYSKPQVFQYLKTIKNNTATEKSHNAPEGLSLEPDVSQQNEVPESLPQYNGDHLVGEKSASQPDLLEGNEISESLPNGWIVQLNTKESGRKYKCYIDPESGCKFYSRPAVFRYLKTVGSSKASEKNESVGCLTGDGTSSELESSQKEQDSKWLPDGWIMEVKTQDRGSRIGMKYKCFTDPVSGRKFYSKPQVLNYLASKNSSVAGKRKAYPRTSDKSSSERDMSQKSKATDVGHEISKTKREKICKAIDDEVISRTPVDGLPPGWIKEIRIRKHSTLKKMDPYYVDPLSDYMFRSKLDALRYLETGDIKKCAMKPMIRDITEKDSRDGDHLTGEKWASPTDLFKGNEISKPLPDGWVVEVKTKSSGAKYKCYIDPESGRKFHSRPEVSRYLKSGKSRKASDKTENVGGLSGDGSSSKADASGQIEVSEWLPDGWTMEVKTGTKNRLKHKCYTEIGSGRKFYSKPQVLKYLGAKDSSLAGSNSEVPGYKSKRKEKAINDYANREVISRAPADGLPPGWIKEIRSRKNASQTDPYYLDPLSVYIFRSKLDVLRYLETGDIWKCAIKPMKRDINEKDSPVCAVDGQKAANTMAKRLFEEPENSLQPQGNNISTTPTIAIPETDPNISEKSSVSTPTDKIAKRSNEMKRLKTSPAMLPGRSSKRLKGIEPETKGDVLLNKRTTRAASRGPATQAEVEPEGAKNGGKDHLGDDEAVQDGRVNLEKQTNDEMAESEISYPLGDNIWTDPCLDFAVKTLTGEMMPADVEPVSVSCQQENIDFDTGKNENPTKVN